MRGRDYWAENAEAIKEAQEARAAIQAEHERILRVHDLEEYRRIQCKISNLSANERRAVVRRVESWNQ